MENGRVWTDFRRFDSSSTVWNLTFFIQLCVKNTMGEPWSLFQDSDSSEEDEKDSCMEEKKNEELIIDNDDRRAFLVYFKHAQYLTFDELFRQILVCKYWYENVTRFCTHVSLKIRHDIHFSTLLSKMRPQSLSCSPYTTTATLYTLVASWRDSLEQIQMPHLHKDREYRTVLQIMKDDPVVLDLANCKASVLTLTYLGLRASRLVKLNLCVSRPGITDSLISNVLKHAPVLRFLNLSGNINLSMRCLQGAITKTLENLSLEGTSCVVISKTQLALIYIIKQTHNRSKSERRGMER